MPARKLKFPFTLNQGTGLSISNTGVDFDGTTPLTYEIGVGNDISTTGKPQFSAVTSSTMLLGSTTIRNYGIDPNFSFTYRICESIKVLQRIWQRKTIYRNRNWT